MRKLTLTGDPREGVSNATDLTNDERRGSKSDAVSR